jgi:hypothetical protein
MVLVIQSISFKYYTPRHHWHAADGDSANKISIINAEDVSAAMGRVTSDNFV